MKKNKVIYYKSLYNNKSLYYKYEYSLPTDEKPGNWHILEEPLNVNKNGFRLTESKFLLNWLGPDIYVAEYGNEAVALKDQIACKEVRLLKKLNSWNNKIFRLFVADCVEQYIPKYELYFPRDKKLSQAVKFARNFVNNKIGEREVSEMKNQIYSNINTLQDWIHRRIFLSAVGMLASHYPFVTIFDRKWQTERLFQYLNGEIKWIF